MMAVSSSNTKWFLVVILAALFLAGAGVVAAQDSADEDDAAEMVSIAATTFEMGASANAMLAECDLFRTGCEIGWFSASEPAHTVQLDSFAIDLYEVTNEAFLAFINELGAVDDTCDGEACLTLEDSAISEGTDTPFVVDDELLAHPVAGVSWYGANAFCEWRGDRLPTEAEWELAASWDFEEETKRVYPWGDEFDGSVVNFCDSNCEEQQANATYDDGFAATAPIGSFADGRSPAGLYDAAGNLWEWVDDWYDPDYYEDGPEENPGGPSSGDSKVVRGGSWFDTGNFTGTAVRFPAPPTESGDSIGFRCASDDVDEANMIGAEASEQAAEPTATEEAEQEPTATATVEPTTEPTLEPTATAEPTLEPTATATAQPTATPTVEPTATAEPTSEPTATATVEPTAEPTEEPTAAPTDEPTATAAATIAATATADSAEDEEDAIAPVSFNCSLYPGQDLGDTYVIGACDRLLKIAVKLGVRYSALLAANPQIVNPNLIYIGDVLNVPERVEAPATEAIPTAVAPARATAAPPEPTAAPSPEPSGPTPTPSSSGSLRS